MHARSSQQSLLIADQVEQRYHIFGGVALECLCTDANFVEDPQEEEAQATTMLVENISFNTLRKLHFKYDEKQKLAELKRTLEAIPQFVKGVKGLE
ncbi:hypothetical protein PI124_g6099 [Phytophthora idaei]|nr:hypothetical protein PI124_g6099 [Phytophthora idaei]